MMALVDDYVEKEEKVRNITNILVICTVFLLAVNIYQFYLLDEKRGLEYSNQVLENRSSTLNSYYDVLTGNYLSLRDDYSDLNNIYSELLSRHYALQQEYDDVVNLRKERALVEDEVIVLEPKGNHTLTYSLGAAGYVEVDFHASGEVFYWVGSPIVEGVYYSRYPQFPQTSRSGVFRVPAASRLYVIMMNPDQSNGVEVSFSISYVY